MRHKRALLRRAVRPATVAILSTGLALAAAGAVAAPSGGKPNGGILRLGNALDFDSLDPAKAYQVYSWWLEYATCAKLFNYPDRAGAAGLDVVPEVVQRFAVSRDRRTYTFELRRTFRFQTGERVTAAGFAAAFNRDADPKLHSDAVDYMHEIVGADAVIDGKASSISGVRVLGPYRLRIRLTRPVDFTTRLTMPFFCPVPPGTPRHEIDDPPGSGPYYVADYVAGQRIVLRRNRYYGGERPAHVDEVVWRLDLSDYDCVAAIEQNQVDSCPVPPSDVRALAEKYGINRPGGRFFVTPGLDTIYFAFNHDRDAFKGPGQIPLAKAINYAIDRHALMLAAGPPLIGTRTDRMLPPPIGRAEHYYPISEADPTTARRWLAKAKVKPEKLVLYTDNSQASVGMAEVLAYDLRRLGIDLEVKYFGFGVVWQKAATRGEPFDIVSMFWGADYSDGASFFRPLLNGGSLDDPQQNNNMTYLDDPRVNAAINAADRLSGIARRKAFADLDARLMRDDPPWAPIFHRNWRTFLSASVGCFFTQPAYGFDIAAVCKK